MHVYYIVMEIYVLVCTNILSPFYFVYVIIMSHHSPTMYFTQSKKLLEPLKTKISIPF
jgi:hypothetical protein